MILLSNVKAEVQIDKKASQEGYAIFIFRREFASEDQPKTRSQVKRNGGLRGSKGAQTRNGLLCLGSIKE